jgi:S-adenosylmethionine decarboxylase
VDGTSSEDYHKLAGKRPIKGEVPMRAELENIAPDIFRQRLLIEGFFRRDVDEQVIRDYLLGLAKHLGLRTYGDPVVFSPGAGTGRAENAGFDAFVPLIDSGISGYFWSARKFLSILLYTCKGFDQETALAYTRSYFEIDGQTVTHAF